MKWLPIALCACACATSRPPVPRDGPAAIVAHYSEDHYTRDIEIAVWPDGEVVFDADGVARHAPIDPALARRAIARAAALVTSLDPSFTTNGEWVDDDTGEEAPDDTDFMLVAVRTRDGYYVVRGGAWDKLDPTRAPRPFTDALALLRALRPASGARQERGFRGEAGVRRVLQRPGLHRFEAR